MSVTQEQLVEQVVREVLARLAGNQPAAAAAPQPEPTSRPASRPTGPAPFPAPNPAPNQPRVKRKVFITAEALRQRVVDGAVALAADERLTPNAVDYVEQNKIRINRLTAATQQPKAPAHAAGVIPPVETFGVVLGGSDATVQSVLTALGRDGMAMTRYDQTDCWMRNSSSMLKCISAGTLGGGVIFVPTGSAACVFANKYRDIRAVVGVSAQQAASVVAEIDANVLIVEFGLRSFFEMRSMVASFIDARRRPRTTNVVLDSIRKVDQR